MPSSTGKHSTASGAMVFISLDNLGNIKAVASTATNGLNVITRSKVDLDPANKPLSACWLIGRYKTRHLVICLL